MSEKATQHYCKHCETSFYVRLHEDETGDFILECPECHWHHYRHFRAGIAVHADINLRDGDPIVIKGRN